MSLSKPMKTSAYRIRRNRMVEAVDAIIDRIEKYWGHLMMAAAFTIYAGVMDSDYKELAAADKRAAEDAQAQRDELIAYTAQNRVRVTLEGDARQVATLAGQVAMVVK